jgi:hypothetical protein
MATQIKLRRDTYQNWFDANPVLAEGEPGYDLTNKKLKIGDGTTLWRVLPYFDDQITDLSSYAGNIIPSVDSTYSLGSPSKRWNDAFLANNSVYIGDIKLSNNSGTLLVQQVTNAGLQTEAPVTNTSVITTDRIINGINNVILESDGSITFPTLTTLDWDRRNLVGPTLQMGNDPTVSDAVITGPAPNLTNPNAVRLIIQGQEGFELPQAGGAEGGDVYVWAGHGGEGADYSGNGGDVKLRGGIGGLNGGYIRLESGDANAQNGNGGFLDLNAGNAY